MDYALTKIDAAVDQLDWAIRLFLDHAAFVPAITLAGAAEEVVGETLTDQSVFAQLKFKLCADFNLPDKVASQLYMNKAKNWLRSAQRHHRWVPVALCALAPGYARRSAAPSKQPR